MDEQQPEAEAATTGITAATSPAPLVAPPVTDDRAAWRIWWRSQGQNWRIEPEIGQERQALLTERRALRQT